MTRISKLITASVLFISTTAQASTLEVQDWNTSKALSSIQARFNQAPDRDAKAKIATQPLNKEALKDQQAVENWDLAKLTAGINPEAGKWEVQNGERSEIGINKACPLVLAIAHGNVDLVEKMLETIDDVNADQIATWGYKQPYSAAHVALDPWSVFKTSIGHEVQLAIIDLLGKKGANFNKITHISTFYRDPPLAAGQSRGHGNILWELKYPRGRAILYGADPTINGNTFFGVYDCDVPGHQVKGEFTPPALEAIQQAWSYYLELSKKDGHNMTLAPSVKAEFEKIRDLEVQRLQAMKF